MTTDFRTTGSIDINPAAAVQRSARFQPDVVAVRYGGGDLTHRQLNERAARLATVLADRGIGVGERVAYLGLNSPAYLVTMLAAFRLGAVFVPVNFRLAGPELATVLSAAGVLSLICEPGHREAVNAVRDDILVRHYLLIDDDPEVPVGSAAGSGWEPWSALLESHCPAKTVIPCTFDDHAILMFTSGTTGRPKGAILTHGNIWWNGVNVDNRLDTRRTDVSYAVAPLFHVGGLNALVLPTLVRGGTVLVRRAFDPQQFLADLVEYRVNSFFAVPAMLNGLAQVPGVFDADLTELRSIVVAGAPVSSSLIRRYAENGVYLQQAWGLTETAPFATHLPVEQTLDRIGSAGIPMPYTAVRVIDPATNTPVEPGVRGEIVVRGPNVIPGYWNNPEATAAAFDDQGWFHSGDIGYIDGDGYLYIVDRLKDLIISGGENVYPAEVENALADLPGTVDVAVVGVPDEQWGEAVVAVLCLGAEVDPITIETVRDHLAQKLARYKLPRHVRILDTMPRNAAGKLDKTAIRRIVAKTV